jgi:hypothetical protein
MTNDTLPPWAPRTRLNAVLALGNYLESVEVAWRTKDMPISKGGIERVARKEMATKDLVSALAGVGLAVSFVPPVPPPPLQVGLKPDAE